MIFAKKDLMEKIDFAVFPGLQVSASELKKNGSASSIDRLIPANSRCSPFRVVNIAGGAAQQQYRCPRRRPQGVLRRLLQGVCYAGDKEC